jgi:SAM-dependent methyltransferase
VIRRHLRQVLSSLRPREAQLARLRAAFLEDDDSFDSLYPDWARGVSRGNFTALEVARRAASLLVAEPGARVLDVGSGVGKLCLVGALTTTGRFHGVEKRAHFVAAARAAAARLAVDRVEFVAANMTEVDWRPFSSFYLFNPFAEYYDKLLEPFEPGVSVDRALHSAYVEHVRAQLDLVAVGARVVTYNGFGGELPAGYRLEHSEPALSDKLDLWIKAE